MSKKVYIIEDNVKNILLFEAVLELIPNIEIQTETQGDKGLELIKSGNPDLIILDINLPEITGTDICIELRKIEKFKNIPIIAVTALAMKGDKERILDAGFTKYLSKPINIDEFSEMVMKFLS